MVFKRVAVCFLGCLGIAHESRKTTPALAPAPAPSEATETSSCSSASSDHASSKVRLTDGRYLAYREMGVPKNISNYKVIMVHGFGSSKEMQFTASQDLMDELGVYLLLFDRAGYGESDPHPKRSMNTEASDIEELADQLQLGSQFYVIGVSLGSYPTWSCLKRIPERLAGVALVVPMINYNWRSFPNELTKDDYRKNLSRWAVWVSRYVPGLLYWWFTQKLFPTSTVLDRNTAFFNHKDLEVLKNTQGLKLLGQNKLNQPGVFDSIRRDFIIAFGKWDFDLLDLQNPYLKNESFVHIWQGIEDKVVPVKLQRHVSRMLPWVRYHEVSDGGHFLVYDSFVCEAILRSLCLGEDSPVYRPKSGI